MIRLSLDALQVLDAIARRGSFGAAGEELHRSASTLSYTVQKLESDLGIKVFDRSGHRASLTVAGRALLEEGRYLLESAAGIERRVRSLASGWEPELTIACDELVGTVALYPLLEAFYAEGHPTRIRITSEVLSGAWDALIAGRAALSIAQEGLAPLVGIATRPLGRVHMVFVCAPRHALARVREPLLMQQIQRHRRVATADTSRSLPPRSSGILGADDTLTVPNMQSKLEAHAAGLGVGFVPRALAADAIRRGVLVEKRVAEPERGTSLCAAWRPKEAGAALNWFLDRLNDPAVRRRLTGAAQA
jgi:DNA-binding transcriptional LysR family regulator